MKKRMFRTIFAVAMVIMMTITGCGKKKELENDDNHDKDMITIGFSIAGSSSDDTKMIIDSISDTFTGESGYTLFTEDAGENEEQQFTAIRDFIKKDVDYIIAAPLEESKEWETVLSEVKQAEIPVIFVGNKIEVEDEQLYTAWIGSDYFQEGYDAGDWLEEYLDQKEEKEKEVQIVMVADSINSMAVDDRFEGFLEQKKISKQTHWNTLEASIEKVQELLEHKEKIDVLLCENDQIALEILKLLDKTKHDITVISFGSSKAVLEAVKQGKIKVEIEQNLSYGSYVEDIIKRLRAGDEIDKIQYVMEDVITQENA